MIQIYVVLQCVGFLFAGSKSWHKQTNQIKFVREISRERKNAMEIGWKRFSNKYGFYIKCTLWFSTFNVK